MEKEKGRIKMGYAMMTVNSQSLALKVYEEALDELKKFQQNPNIIKLKLAGDKLVEVLKYNKQHAESYFCLSVIFYILDSYKASVKYLSFGERLSKKIPEDVIKFKNEILIPEMKKREELANSKNNKSANIVNFEISAKKEKINEEQNDVITKESIRARFFNNQKSTPVKTVASKSFTQNINQKFEIKKAQPLFGF